MKMVSLSDEISHSKMSNMYNLHLFHNYAKSSDPIHVQCSL